MGVHAKIPDEREVAAGQPVIVISGQSGAGKGTLVSLLIERIPELALAVSATTRAARPGEDDGVHYWFIGQDEFDRHLADGDFLEWVDYVGNRYGTLRSEIDRIAAKGSVCVLELDPQGALTVAAGDPRCITFFITAPLAELERRLNGRATETAEEAQARVELAARQLALTDRFDHVIVNDDLKRALAELSGAVADIIAAADARQRTGAAAK